MSRIDAALTAAIRPLEEFRHKGDKRRITLSPPDGCRSGALDSYVLKLWRDGRCEIVMPFEIAGVRKSEELARSECARHYVSGLIAAIDLDALRLNLGVSDEE